MQLNTIDENVGLHISQVNKQPLTLDMIKDVDMTKRQSFEFDTLATPMDSPLTPSPKSQNKQSQQPKTSPDTKSPSASPTPRPNLKHKYKAKPEQILTNEPAY